MQSCRVTAWVLQDVRATVQSGFVETINVYQFSKTYFMLGTHMPDFTLQFVYCNYNRIWSDRYFKPSSSQSSTSNPFQIIFKSIRCELPTINCVLIRLMNRCCLFKEISCLCSLQFNIIDWISHYDIWNETQVGSPLGMFPHAHTQMLLSTFSFLRTHIIVLSCPDV